MSPCVNQVAPRRPMCGYANAGHGRVESGGLKVGAWVLVVASLVVVACSRPARPVLGVRAVLVGATVAGARTGNESPGIHSARYSFDNGIQWDLYGSPGADVYAAFRSSDGFVSLSVRDGGEVGLGTGRIALVTVRIDGEKVGVVRFMHLDSVDVSARSPSDRIGELPPPVLHPDGCFGWPCSANWNVRTPAGIHVHLDVDHGCYRQVGALTPIEPSEPLIMIASRLPSGNTEACDPDEMRRVNPSSRDS